MTDDLVQFLRDRLAEDARDAEAAGDSWYGYEPEQQIAFVSVEDARHIARHDPARVLREVEAKRQIVDGYALTLQLRDEAATRIRAAGDTPDAEDLDTWDRAQSEAAILRDPVALLALPFSDHPDCREEWRS